MDASILLCDSTICRLCAEENLNGTLLFPSDENKENLSETVNKYLPLKVEKDGKYPRILCPGCTIQLEATKSFFDLIIEGQCKLRELFATQQETLRRQEKQKEQLENALKIVNPNSSVQTYSVQTDETGEKFFIQILSEGPLFPPDHEMSLRTEGLDKPKKKRGRPPKSANVLDIEIPEVEAEVKEEEPEFDADGKRKRKIKKPSRYSELIQGKELDKLLKQEGVFDDDDDDPIDQVHIFNDINDSDNVNEIIGHMRGKDGENLGKLIVLNKNGSKNRARVKSEAGKRKYECDFCGRGFLHPGRLEIHKSFHKNIQYQCGKSGDNSCLLNFETKQSLDEHQKKSGHIGSTLIERLENYGQLELPQKQNNSPKENVLSQAIANLTLPSDTSTEQLACPICEKAFSSQENLDLHTKTVHETAKTEIPKKFPFLTKPKPHILQHPEKSYPCESCHKVFNHPSSLVYHREAEHNNGRKFVCNKCKKSFKHKQLLLKHQLVHSNERPHICKSCGASFKTRANLLNHMPTHTGEKKYYCSQCGQSFAHKTSLTLHLRWHNGQKPFECDVCMKTFSQKGNLSEHRRIHTGEKPYCCTYCGRRFTTSSQFKLHVKRHTGERPWKCEYCSKTFLHKDTWKCHMRRHRNERPFQCQQCLRGFTEQWALKKHERLHTGEKPYVCDICSKSFADSSNLTKHKKIHRNVKNKLKEKQALENLNLINLKNNIEQDVNEILYLSYGEANATDAQQPSLINEQLFTNTGILNDNDSDEMSLDVQLQQLVDNDGNPINLTTTDGQQIKVVTTMGDNEQCIQGLLPDGTLIPIDLTMQDGKPISAEMFAKGDDELKKNAEDTLADSTSILEQENIHLLDEEASIDNKMQFLNAQAKISDPNLQNKLQFLTEDGQNLCFITAYDIDNMDGQYIIE